MKTRKFLLIFITLYTIFFLGRGLHLIGINWLIYPVYFLLFILGILAYREELKEQLALILTKKKEFLKTISLYMVFVFFLSIACNLLSALIKQSLGLAATGAEWCQYSRCLVEKSLSNLGYRLLYRANRWRVFLPPLFPRYFFGKILWRARYCVNNLSICHPSYAQLGLIRVGDSYFLYCRRSSSLVPVSEKGQKYLVSNCPSLLQ